MDAKVLQAAVAAAIRVTVSTTLIGCGGNFTSDATPPGAGGKASAEAGRAGQSSQEPPAPSPVEIGGGGAMVASGGGSEVGGTPLAAAGESAAGEPSSGGAAPLGCAAEIEACLPVLEAVDPTKGFAGNATSCCQTVITGLFKDLPKTIPECEGARTRFRMAAGNTQCCQQNSWIWSLDGKNVSGCTPWGPPVPPELSLARLEAMRVAA
jgi:hypothetical protein